MFRQLFSDYSIGERLQGLRDAAVIVFALWLIIGFCYVIA